MLALGRKTYGKAPTHHRPSTSQAISLTEKTPSAIRLCIPAIDYNRFPTTHYARQLAAKEPTFLKK
jgi:hypothetical protein